MTKFTGKTRNKIILNAANFQFVGIRARTPVSVMHAFEAGLVVGMDNDIIELGAGMVHLLDKILSPLGTSLRCSKIQ